MERKEVSAAIIVNEHKNVLLQLRDIKPSIRSSGMWSLPGGGREPEESSEDAIRREVFEETNIKLRSPKYFMSLIDLFEGDEPIKVDFYIERIRQPFSIIVGEGQDLKFFSQEEVKKLHTNIYLPIVIEYGLRVLNIIENDSS